MFKLIRLSLNGKCEGQSFSYSFADGINYFKGKNDSGKTEFYTFLDYMFGANINLADKDWFRDSLISAECKSSCLTMKMLQVWSRQDLCAKLFAGSG